MNENNRSVRTATNEVKHLLIMKQCCQRNATVSYIKLLNIVYTTLFFMIHLKSFQTVVIYVIYSEGPATGHLDTGFSRFPCVYKQILRWCPTFQVATTCFSCSPPDLNLLVTNFIFCIHVK